MEFMRTHLYRSLALCVDSDRWNGDIGDDLLRKGVSLGVGGGQSPRLGRQTHDMLVGQDAAVGEDQAVGSSGVGSQFADHCCDGLEEFT